MWKAVIADDEGVILQGLKKLVDWTNMDVHLVGEARDGQQLKEVMEETDPDIVITDIMMPHRTGLDILRWCNEADMHAKFIFISGYQKSLRLQRLVVIIFTDDPNQGKQFSQSRHFIIYACACIILMN